MRRRSRDFHFDRTREVTRHFTAASLSGSCHGTIKSQEGRGNLPISCFVPRAFSGGEAEGVKPPEREGVYLCIKVGHRFAFRFDRRAIWPMDSEICRPKFEMTEVSQSSLSLSLSEQSCLEQAILKRILFLTIISRNLRRFRDTVVSDFEADRK